MEYLYFQVDYNGKVDYAWLDITEVNVAYFSGQIDAAVLECQFLPISLRKVFNLVTSYYELLNCTN